MRYTGIVKRIDELGRIQIPKNIREDLGINEGDPFEICTYKDTVNDSYSIIFVKYNDGDGFDGLAEEVK